MSKGKGKDDGGRDSRRVFGGIAGRAGNAPGNRGSGRYSTDQVRPPQPPRPIVGRDDRGGRGGGNSN